MLNDQINSIKNVDIIMNFMIKTFNQKINDAANENEIQIQLNKPNFSGNYFYYFKIMQ